MNKVMISAKNIEKTFRIPHEKHTSMKQVAVSFFKKRSFTEFNVLRGVSFDIYEGDFFGIVGRNGSGKSTLLKILAGIYTYDKGNLQINGKISPFLELGVGFNPELTGRENVFLNGAILGLSRKEIEKKYDEIVEFSELSQFMDQRLKNYSSGMQVRLAFSVAIHAHAPIILLDEVLAVGDTNFQAKCENVFGKLKKEGRTIVFVSHSMASVRKFCNRAVLIDKGKIVSEGDPEVVANVYENINLGISKSNNKFDSSELLLKSVGLVNKNLVVNEKDEIAFVFDLLNNSKKKLPFNIAFDITRDACKVGGNCTNYGKEKDYSIDLKPGSSSLVISIGRECLLPGEYTLGFRMFAKNIEDIYVRQAEALRFKVVGEKNKIGIVDFHEKIDFLDKV